MYAIGADQSMRDFVAQVEAAGIGVQGEEMQRECGSQALTQLIVVENIAHANDHANSGQRGMRLGDRSIQFGGDAAKALLHLGNEHVDGLNIVLIKPGSDAFYQKREIVEETAAPRPARKVAR